MIHIENGKYVIDKRINGTESIAVYRFGPFKATAICKLFHAHPDILPNCPLLAVAGAVLASARAHNVLGELDIEDHLLTGKDIPIPLKDESFEVVLLPAKICDEKEDKVCESLLVTLHPQKTSTAIIYLEP